MIPFLSLSQAYWEIMENEYHTKNKVQTTEVILCGKLRDLCFTLWTMTDKS